MSHEKAVTATFCTRLIEIDEELVVAARSGGCSCGGRLDRADYERKPRGAESADQRFAMRFSLCCSREGCRKRLLPPSVRFLGRRVYLGPVVLLASAYAFLSPSDPPSATTPSDPPRRTVGRWRLWWRTAFIASAFFVTHAPLFMPPLEIATLPASLIARMPGAAEPERLLAAVRWLSPIGSRSSEVG